MILLLLLLLPSSFPAETSLGVGSSVKRDDTTLQLNYREMIWGNNYLQFKTGYFGGVHLGAGSGLLVNLKPFQVRGGLSVGPTTGITLLELNPEAYLGVRDVGGNAVGLQFDHFTGSNGRNYITLQMSQDF